MGEDTPADREFRYIEISTTGRGQLVAEPVQMTFAEAPSRARRVLSPGDTIVSTVRTYLRAVWTLTSDEADFVASTGFACLRPTSRIDAAFLGWLAQSDVVVEEIVARSVGVSYPAVKPNAIGTIRVALPSLDRQQVVVDFLDREVSRVDALIEKSLRLLGALSEAKPVTASMELLGTIDGPGSLRASWPETWERVPFRWLFREVDDRSSDGSEELMSVSQTRGVIPQAELGDRRQFAETLAGYKICRKDDLVINRMWVYYGALGVAPAVGLISPDYSVFRSRGKLRADLAAHILRTPPYVGEMTRLVRGVGSAFQGAVRKPRLHPRELGQIVMPVPPMEEQHRLISEVVRHRDGISEKEELIGRSIALLKERRQALITAAVTGQLELPEAA